MKKQSAEQFVESVLEMKEQTGETFICQENYVQEESVMTDEDVSGREPLQKLRLAVQTDQQQKCAEFLFYTAAELEELMIELQPVFDKFPKNAVSPEKMNEKFLE